MRVLSWIDAKTYEMSGLVDEATLAIFFYGSLMFAFIAYLHIKQAYPLLPGLPFEGQYLVPFLFFTLGRQMSRIDVAPALKDVGKQLEHMHVVIEQSQAVMEDLLPGFVVDAIMSNTQDDMSFYSTDHTIIPDIELETEEYAAGKRTHVIILQAFKPPPHLTARTLSVVPQRYQCLCKTSG